MELYRRHYILPIAIDCDAYHIYNENRKHELPEEEELGMNEIQAVKLINKEDTTNDGKENITYQLLN